jgi:phenylacetate-coenzyme A ligase PaaK-like adenylate-forming protein
LLATAQLIQEAALPYRLGAVLPRWLREVPLYNAHAEVPLLTGGAVPLAQLRRLPLITKQDIRRDFPRNFLRAGVELDALLDQDLVELEQTSGTSEERTPLLLGRGWWNEQEERALRLNPLVAAVLDEFPAARRVTINSPVCSGDICYTGVPSRADRIVGSALFVSLSRYPFLWSEPELARMAAEAAAWQPQFLDVDPVYGVLFALYCERRGIRLPSLRFILGSYEFLSGVHRRILERAFDVPVFNLYGSTETGHLLMEDGRSQMRPSLETALLEVVNPDDQGISELAVTTLTNDYMPLIRYRIGDLVERHERPYYTSYTVHGRAADAFHTADGRRVTTWQIDQCFADVPGIAHYQLCQRPAGEWLLRFVPDIKPPTAPALEELRRRLAQLLSAEGKVTLQQTDLLVPENSGKFRLGYPAKPVQA